MSLVWEATITVESSNSWIEVPVLNVDAESWNIWSTRTKILLPAAVGVISQVNPVSVKDCEVVDIHNDEFVQEAQEVNEGILADNSTEKNP